MADRAKKKEKHRLKRASKQRALRKTSALSPLQLIARNPKHLKCQSATQQGLTSLFVFGTAMDGRHASAVFLIDSWCVGLKDAYGWASVTLKQFDDIIEKAERVHPLAEINPDEARGMVASAIRFSRQNGFRPPPGWEKWAAIFGGPPDVANADLSNFGKDGGLLYVGTQAFLEKNLIGCTPGEFFARPGVHFMMQERASNFAGLGDVAVEEDDDGEYDDEDEETNEIEELALPVNTTERPAVS